MMLIMGALVFYPLAGTFVYSLKNWKLTEPENIRFIGLENYAALLRSPSFWYSVQNTVFILVLTAVITTVGGVAAALFLNVETKLSGCMLAVSILPWALPPYVNGILWRFIFYPGYGLMNKLFIRLHIIDEPVEWFSSRWTLLLVVSFVVVWRSIPFTALVCLSGRKAISEELYEAAQIDGGSKGVILRRVTLPLILPFAGIGLTASSVAAMNVFDEIIALSGYSDLGKNILVESYLTTFSFMDFGRGSAAVYLIMLFSAILGAFYIKGLIREEK